MAAARTRRDLGESLVEIVLAVVVISIAVSALVSGLATAANAAGTQRHSVVADTTLRNVAEAAKLAAESCVAGDPLVIDHTPPPGWTTVVEPTAPICPAATTTLTLSTTATSPTGQSWSLDVVVRTP